MNVLNNMPLISVIVPVYGTEKYLRKCLDSILGQTYKNIEIIIVNDCTKDNSEEIIIEYMNEYSNIKYVRHSKNKGLFRARISGAEEATGEYIAFVDSDDYISCDFYRMMVKKAVETDSDMVLADFVLEFEDMHREYFNYDMVRNQNLCLEGENVLKTFMDQKGLCYSWQLVWNKLYKKCLWDKGYKKFVEFSNNNIGLIMTEDIAFSSFFWSNASKVTNIHNVTYFYCQHKGQSTDISGADSKKILRNIDDTISVFDFFKSNLEMVGKFDVYRNQYYSWKKLMGKINFNTLTQKKVQNDFAEKISDGFFEGENIELLSVDDNYFYSISTRIGEEWNWYEEIKKNISSDNCEYVSFDIFDTLILRPFWVPSDMFGMLDKYFHSLCELSSDVVFSEIRKECEKLCREDLVNTRSAKEDITLDEIYNKIADNYYFSKEICDKMKQKEIEYEYRFCYARKTGKELFELAQYCDKKVIMISDMYLSADIIKEILSRNGFSGYEKLFVSSEYKVTKWTGNLYKAVFKELDQIVPEQIIHIGDNWKSDVEMPKKYGIRSFHLDSPINIFSNSNGGIYAGEAFKQCFVTFPTWKELGGSGGLWGFSGLRSMLAVVANEIFDMPYVSFNKATDFNSNPYYIGYFALGMHIFAVLKWLISNLSSTSAKKVHFVARDGYIIKCGYDLLASIINLPESNYLYVSRKALALADIRNPVDMYSLINKLNITGISPDGFLNIFKDMISPEDIKYFKCSSEYDFVDNIAFKSRVEYEKFLKLFIEKLWDKIDWSEYRKRISDYFSNVMNDGDALFDIGYSGRVESALHTLMGYTINSYYIHSNNESLERRKDYYGFRNRTFYDYKPDITGVMREHMFMKMAPSTVGYMRKNNAVEPVFEKYAPDFQTIYTTGIVQDAAIKFISDLTDKFGEEILSLYFRCEDASQPFEYYLHYGQIIDRNLFSTLIFEDDFGEGRKLRAVDFWSNEIKRTLESKKNISFENRVVGNDRLIGEPKTDFYRVKRENKPVKSLSKLVAAYFCDLKHENSNNGFFECAENTNNIVSWEAVRTLTDTVMCDNWFMTNPEYDNNIDVFIISNLSWIQENQDLTYLDRVLDNIKDKPVLPIEIGLSTDKEKKDFYLSAESVKSLAAVAERCKTIGVHGSYTAEILSGFGIKNIDIVGSPVAYIDIMAIKNIPEKSLEGSIKKVSASFKPFYGILSEKEISLLKYFGSNNFSLVRNTPQKLEIKHVENKTLYSTLKQYSENDKVYFDLKTWSQSFNEVNFAMGMNFYNNVLAIRNSVPALFINSDTYSRELCDFFNFPSIDIEDFNPDLKTEDYYKMADYTDVANVIDHRYSEFCEFLKKNGVTPRRSITNIILK